MFSIREIRKLIRFITIYGFSRAINKSFGRTRLSFLRKIYFLPKAKSISIIGCGQFAFSTIGYFLAKCQGNKFLNCFDIDSNASKSLGNYYKFNKVSQTISEFYNEVPTYLYIASNHASHTPYALDAMRKYVKHIYIEKPIAVSIDQLVQLLTLKSQFQVTLYAGYNRPYSDAIIYLKNIISYQKKLPFTINYFVSGHELSADHWYRKPEEGTRVCGNIGHWIDLTIHLFNFREYYPKQFFIKISYSNLSEPDDNLDITITTELHDMVNICMTSRSEPFEGINETINLQYGKIIAKIDDFRKMDVWVDDIKYSKKYFPKDVGHKRAILQPFSKNNRDWNEVEISTLLMLYIKDMVINTTTESVFNTYENIELLELKIRHQLHEK